MADCFVNCTGVLAAVAAHAFRGLGPFPTASMVYYRPQQPNIPARVNLTLGHGLDQVTFYDCLVDTASSTRNSRSGFLETLKLLDRRWNWEYRLVSGRYNQRTASGTLNTATQKTPQELATLLFQAMGETNFDVSALPNDGYPEMNWQYSRANLELYQLCVDRGCNISLNTDNSVSIVRLGVGDPAQPSLDGQWYSQTVDPPTPPDELIGICGPTVVESLFRLKAIGLDVDGQFKAIDDLSYKPDGGWEIEPDIEHFGFLDEDPIAQACARRTVYKYYQIDAFADGTLELLGYSGVIDSISQCLPINQTTLDTYTDETGKLVAAPAEVLGQFVVAADPALDENCANGTTYDGEFDIDSKTGIVRFRRRVYRYDSNFNIVPAKLFLRTSFRMEDAEGQIVRDIVTYNLAAGGGVNQYPVQIPEVNRRHQVTWTTDSETPTPDGFTNNQADIDAQATAILTGVASRFTFSVGGKMTYRSIQNFTTNGVIRQIYWTVSENGAQTIASNNFECIPFISPSPRQRQRSTYKVLDVKRLNRALDRADRNGVLE